MNIKKIILGLNFRKISPVQFFVLVASIFGLLFIITVPPFQAPDEPVHFFRTYQISEGNLRVDKVGTVYGGMLPSSLEQTVTLTAYSPQIAFMPGQKYDVHETRKALNIHTTASQQAYDFSTSAYYSPVSYIPQALGVFIGRVLTHTPIISMYLGRIFNLAAWIVCFVIAIRFMPRKKWAVAFVGLIPMALFQAASLSSDVAAIGLLAVTMAFVLKLVDQSTPLRRKELLILGGMLSLVVLSKQAMFVFLPLALLLPGKLFKDRKTQYISKALLIGVPLVLFGGWMLAAGNVPQSTAVNGINPTLQREHMTHNPFNFINATVNTYAFSWGDGITKSFFGNFGWVDTPLAEPFVVVGYIAMFLLFVANAKAVKKAWLSTKQRLLLLAIGLAYVAAVTAALYVYFTPVDFKIIIGLVGRYYVPFALLLIPVLSGSWLTMKEDAYRRIAIWTPLLLLTASYVTIYFRYYIHNV